MEKNTGYNPEEMKRNILYDEDEENLNWLIKYKHDIQAEDPKLKIIREIIELW